MLKSDSFNKNGFLLVLTFTMNSLLQTQNLHPIQTLQDNNPHLKEKQNRVQTWSRFYSWKMVTRNLSKVTSTDLVVKCHQCPRSHWSKKSRMNMVFSFFSLMQNVMIQSTIFFQNSFGRSPTYSHQNAFTQRLLL